MANDKEKIKVVFYGARQSGIIALLTILATDKFEVVGVVPSDDLVFDLANLFNIRTEKTNNINNQKIFEFLKSLKPDLLFSCHGKHIVGENTLDLFKWAVNIHPCLYKYKGLHPIDRLLEDGETRASVGSHWMIKEVDKGDVIIELFKDVESKNVIGVYNELYPLYSKVIKKTLDHILILK